MREFLIGAFLIGIVAPAVGILIGFLTHDSESEC